MSDELEATIRAAVTTTAKQEPPTRTEHLARLRAVLDRAESDAALPLSEVATVASAVAGESTPAPAVELTSTAEALERLRAKWERNEPPVSTGLRQLDGMLAGGLRAGDVIAIGGAAKGGKSAFAGGIAIEAAKWRGNDGTRAVVVYASVEMPAEEVTARWVAAEAYRRTKAESRAVTFSDVLYGGAYRGGTTDTLQEREEVRERLDAAMRGVAALDNLHTVVVPPGSTPDTLRDLVLKAREREVTPPALTLLVIDPIQRLYVAPQGALSGRALDSVNGNETERVGIVAQQVKAHADTLGLAVLFTSDGTKASAGGGQSSAQSLRGSYHLNHLATTIMGIRTAETAEALAEKLNSGDDPSAAASLAKLLAEVGGRWQGSDDQIRTEKDLSARLAFVDVSGHRRGAGSDMVFRFVRGAMVFVEPKRKPVEQRNGRGR